MLHCTQEFFRAAECENHRGPEVPEARVPVEECRDGLARITLEEVATIHSVRSGTGEKCSFAHRQVDAQPTKWSKSNGDKSAVATLGNWQERESVSDAYHH